MPSRPAEQSPGPPANATGCRCPFCDGPAVVSTSRVASPYRRCGACGAVWHPDRLRARPGRVANNPARPIGLDAGAAANGVMTVTLRRTLHGAVISLAGRLTGNTGGQLRDSLTVTRNQVRPRIILNLAQVTSVDRGGANALLDVYVATTLRAGSLALTRLPIGVRETLRDFSLLDTLQVFASDGLAMAAMAESSGNQPAPGGLQ